MRTLVAASVALVLARSANAAEPAIDRARLTQLVDAYDGKSIKPMGRGVLPELVRMYESGDEEARSKVAAILYQLRWRSPDAKKILMKDLHTKNQSLRLNVQYALGSVSGDLDVVDALVGNMQNDDNPLFRDKAACALAYDQVHLTPAQKAHLFGRLIESLDSPTLQVRQIALQALQIHTGQTKDFTPGGPLDDRRKSIDAWRKWLGEYRASVGS